MNHHEIDQLPGRLMGWFAFVDALQLGQYPSNLYINTDE